MFAEEFSKGEVLRLETVRNKLFTNHRLRKFATYKALVIKMAKYINQLMYGPAEKAKKVKSRNQWQRICGKGTWSLNRPPAGVVNIGTKKTQPL